MHERARRLVHQFELDVAREGQPSRPVFRTRLESSEGDAESARRAAHLQRHLLRLGGAHVKVAAARLQPEGGEHLEHVRLANEEVAGWE